MYHLIYPEERDVSEDQLRMWHADKTADGDIGMYLEGIDYPKGGPIPIEYVIYDLENIGIITVGRRR